MTDSTKDQIVQALRREMHLREWAAKKLLAETLELFALDDWLTRGAPEPRGAMDMLRRHVGLSVYQERDIRNLH